MGRAKLAKASYLSLATFRKSGEAVATPVWFAEENNTFYIFSANNAGKVKRLRNSARARIAACTVTGRLTGDWVEAQATVLSEAEAIEKAKVALQRKYGWQMTLTNTLSRLSGKINQRAYLAVTPK